MEDYEGAYDDFTFLIRTNINVKKALLGRAKCSYELQRYKRVTMDVNRVLNDDPENIEGLQLRGNAYVKLFKHGYAILDLTKVIAAEPQNVLAYVNRGAAYARAGPLYRAKAIQDFDKAIKLDPRLPVAYFNKGVVFFLSEYWEGAIEIFNEALAIDPEYAEAITRRGMSKQNSPKYTLTQACLDFRNADKLGDELATEYVKEFCSK